MRHLLLLLGALLLPAGAGHAQSPGKVRCPGENTLEMRSCAEASWQQSTLQVQRRIPKALGQQWQTASRAVCSRAYAPYRDGSIYPQLVVGCEDHLNRALLREFAPLNNQGDPERRP